MTKKTREKTRKMTKQVSNSYLCVPDELCSAILESAYKSKSPNYIGSINTARCRPPGKSVFYAF